MGGAYGQPSVLIGSIAEIFERGLAVGFSTGAEYLNLWTAYIDYLRRGVEWDRGTINSVCCILFNFVVNGGKRFLHEVGRSVF